MTLSKIILAIAKPCGELQTAWVIKCSALNCTEILKSSMMQVSPETNLAPNIQQYAQRSMLHSKHEQQPLRRISCHGRNYSQPYFFKRNQSSDNRSHGFGAKFLLKKLSASDFSYERKSALRQKLFLATWAIIIPGLLLHSNWFKSSEF